MKIRKWILLGALTCCLAYFASWLVGRSLLSAQVRPAGIAPREISASAFEIKNELGSKIGGWHARKPGNKGVLVLLHGNRGSRHTMLRRAKLFYELGFSIVMIDLQAHGESDGDSISMGFREQHDARAAVDYARRKHPNTPIGVVGVSLGAASAVLASPLGVDAMIIESCFPSAELAIRNRVESYLGPLSWLPTKLLALHANSLLGAPLSSIRPIDSIALCGCPLLIISGSEDEYTPPKETRAIFESAREPKTLWIVDQVAHEDIQRAVPDQYRERVGRFLNRHLASGDDAEQE